MSLFSKNRFEFDSPLSFGEARAVVRRFNTKDISYASERIWGLTIGRYILLIEGFLSYAPTIHAWMSDTPHGVRITGYGRVSVGLYLSFFGFLLLIAGRSVWVGELEDLWWLLIFGLAFPLGFVADTVWRKDADPLITALRKELKAEDASGIELEEPVHVTSFADKAYQPEDAVVDVRMIFNGKPIKDQLTMASLLQAIDELDDTNFLILEAAPMAYMQTAKNGGGFVLEYQIETLEKHFRAAEAVDRQSATAALAHYMFTREPHPDFDWEQIDLS